MPMGAKFAVGKFAKALDDRFGEKVDYKRLVREADTKLMVLPEDCDDPDPYRRLRSRQDAIALRNPRPELSVAEFTPIANGIFTAQSLGAAGAFNLNGSYVSGGVATLDPDGNPKQVILTSTGNDSGIYFTITGTLLPPPYNPLTGIIDGPAPSYTETLQGANAGIAGSFNAFYTVTSITALAATASAVIAGTQLDDSFFDAVGV